jgi:formylglycine-generating enzyme required for sulfatase activity
MGIDWNNYLEETMAVDTASIAIDKWNSSKFGGKDGRNVAKYKDGTRSGNSNEMYTYGEASLITDRTRVFKGGSWKDRAYWLNPGTRRFLDENQSTDAIGFRCAMDRLGGQTSKQKQKQIDEKKRIK